MATATYNQQNSYDELQWRPFELNYEAQLKELGAKNQYWMEGVNKIQSAYSKITGLNPQWAKNKEALKSFNDQAKEQIKKIASTDLGVQGNAEQVNGVIAPLYDMTNPVSEGIILDDYANKTGQTLVKTIESYKTKDKGIYYSATNEKYALEWYQDYMRKANDPNATLDDLRKVKENVKGYTPYHDYSKELETAITKCPENSTTETDILKQGYFQTRSSATKQVGPCIESFLSDKAKSQMDINGYVQFGKDYQSLGHKILEISSKNADSYSDNLGKIAARLAIPGISKEEKEALTQQQGEINSELNRLNQTNSKLASGDFSDIEKNYAQYAGLAYRTTTISNLNKAYSQHKDKTEYEANPVFLLEQRLQADAIENERDRTFEASQNIFKEPLPELVSTQSADGSTNIETNKETFIQSGKDVKDQLTDVESQLFSYIYKKYGDNAKLDVRDKKQLESFVKGIIETNPLAKADKDVQSYLATYEKKKMAVDLWNTEYNRIQTKINDDLKSVPGLQGNITIQTFDGEKFNIKRSDIINKVIAKSDPGQIGTSYMYIKDNGNQVQIMVSPVFDQDITSIFKETQAIKDKHYKNSLTPNSMWMSNENMNLDKTNVFRNQLVTTFLPSVDGDGKKIIDKESDIRVGRTNWDGQVEVSLPGISEEEGITKLQGLGYKAEYRKDGKFLIKGSKEFTAQNADPSIGTTISISMQKIGETSYPPQQEIPIISTYKNRFKIFTMKSTPGKIYVKDLTQNRVVYNTDNITEITDYLLNLKRN